MVRSAWVCSAPGQEFGLVGVGREAVDRVDLGAHGDGFVEDLDRLGPVDDLAGERALGGVADEDDGSLRPPQVVAQVMADAAAGAHA